MPAPIDIGSEIIVSGGPPEAHCRTPFYLRGKHGLVVADMGAFRDPALLAYHKPGLPVRRLFRVRFRQCDLWPDYRGPDDDALFADLYASWLSIRQTTERDG